MLQNEIYSVPPGVEGQTVHENKLWQNQALILEQVTLMFKNTQLDTSVVTF